MNKDDLTQAILIEIRNALRTGWSATCDSDGIAVVGPDAPDFIAEVWRIARFIAYDDYVSIERQTGASKEYRVTSRSRRGLAFEVLIRARE